MPVSSPDAHASRNAAVRVVIVGNSGSGKSTLAASIAAVSGATCLDLDTVAWEPGQSATPRAESAALADVETFCRRHFGWIVEGCYERLACATLGYRPNLVFLNPGLEACLANCRARAWEPHKYESRKEQDANLSLLLCWVEQYYMRPGPMSLAAHREFFAAYAGPKREVRSLPAVGGRDSVLIAWSLAATARSDDRSGPAAP
jgi:adenylate kinase family enzyme